MITIENYFKEFKNIDTAGFPPAMIVAHDFLVKATDGGNNLSAYYSNPSIKNTLDIYLSKVNEFARKDKKGSEKQQRQDSSKKKERKIPETKKDEDVHPAIMVERIPEELRFIKRFVNLNGKTKTKDELLRFINSLQKAILEKRIRKTSPYAEQIKLVQDKLIGIYNSMKSKIKIELKQEPMTI